MFSIAMVMMPVTTAGLNELPESLIPHGSAMNNTFRQVSGAIGTALLVTIMATSSIPEDGIEGLIHGVNVSFIVASIISVLGLLLAFFVKAPNKQLHAYQNRIRSNAHRFVESPLLLFYDDYSREVHLE